MTLNLPEGVHDTFTHRCVTCGATVHVEHGETQPHRCRIDLDAQRGPEVDGGAS
jgi:hypothetical protein